MTSFAYYVVRLQEFFTFNQDPPIQWVR